MTGEETSCSFSESDFWFCDLGLEFFHWPAQKVLKKDIHRSCGCTVLESTNPDPGTNGYSRVVSWVDDESLGIVEAYAYDRNGKQLKDFYPKDFKKINGQWQVQTLIMENVQTGSKSRIEFDLKK
ncbi:MAG TPA: outer membrane lipoprotein-sorting protein [Candidatus Sulfotelmatobacter sp.]|nr:outer membrane lipoprotein-sorting protein [Candidatus Sulfotelmatobacter sp.]